MDFGGGEETVNLVRCLSVSTGQKGGTMDGRHPRVGGLRGSSPSCSCSLSERVHVSGSLSLQMRSQLYQEEDRCSEQERMRNEISDLTQELHQKEITIATVMKKAALLERQLKIELEIKEKMLTKQQVCRQESTLQG